MLYMRFEYSYNTKQNERRDGEIVASSRDEAFAKLKASGIRPFRVDLAPGLWNRIQSIGKRGLAIVILAIGVIVSVAYVCVLKDRLNPANPRILPRQQVTGDQNILEDGLAYQWREVFERPGERWLAMYAMPGRVPRSGLKEASPLELYVVLRDFDENLEKRVLLKRSALPEYRQIAAIVEGMKQELREAIKKGMSSEQYLHFLAERQAKEYGEWLAAYDRLIKIAKKGDEIRDRWVEECTALKKRGIMALPPPEKILEESFERGLTN